MITVGTLGLGSGAAWVSVGGMWGGAAVGGAIGGGISVAAGGTFLGGAGWGADIGSLVGGIAGPGLAARLLGRASPAGLVGAVQESVSPHVVQAARSGTLNEQLLAEGLRGVTARSTLVADAISDYSLGVKWYDTLADLRAAYGGTKAGVGAFHAKGVLHLVRDVSALESAVHEGIHGLRWLRSQSWAAAKYKDIRSLSFRSGFWEEFLANAAEQQFKAAAYGTTPWTRLETLRHVRDSYPELMSTIDAESLMYLRRYGL